MLKKIVRNVVYIMQTNKKTITKEEYLERRKTESRTQIRLSLGLGPISFDRMLEELGVNLQEDKSQRIDRKKIAID